MVCVGDWEQFRKRVWRRGSFVKLTPMARLLYLWTWTSPDYGNLAGLYSVSPLQLERALADEGDWRREAVAAALQELAEKPLVLYDEGNEVLWVVGRVENVLKSPTQATRIAKDFEACPPSPLREKFVATYGELLRSYGHELGRDW